MLYQIVRLSFTNNPPQSRRVVSAFFSPSLAEHRRVEAKQPIVKYSTICAYRLALRTHLIPRFGSMVQIHEAEVEEFIVDKMRAGMAKKTVRDIVAVLRAVVRYGARLHLCERENGN